MKTFALRKAAVLKEFTEKNKEDIESNLLFKNNYFYYSCFLYYGISYEATALSWNIFEQTNFETFKLRILLTLNAKKLTKLFEDGINEKKAKFL